MRGNLNIRMLSVRATLLAALVAGLMLTGAGAQSAKQKQGSEKQASGSSTASTQAQAPSTASKAAEEENATADKEHAGGPHEGIKVHGHWLIDVRNPNGTLAEHRDFENAYVGNLPAVLAGQVSIGGWQIALLGSASTYFLPAPVTQVGVVSPLSIGGSWTATNNDTISIVRSQFNYCSATISPAACASSPAGSESFSVATLSVPVSVVQGQIVQVSVTFTFS